MRADLYPSPPRPALLGHTKDRPVCVSESKQPSLLPDSQAEFASKAYNIRDYKII